MVLNGSEWVDAPWNTTWSPYTDLFFDIFGNGQIFFIVPIIVLAFGVYYKTDSPLFATTFFMGISAILSIGTFMGGLSDLSMLFTIFAAISFSIVVISIIFQKKGG